MDGVSGFVAGEFDSAFGSWGENVQSWLAIRGGSPDFLLLQYENMKADPEGALRQVGDFLAARSFPYLEMTPQAIRRAVELSSSDRMRALEKEQAKDWVLTKTLGRINRSPLRSKAGNGGRRSRWLRRNVSKLHGVKLCSAWDTGCHSGEFQLT